MKQAPAHGEFLALLGESPQQPPLQHASPTVKPPPQLSKQIACFETADRVFCGVDTIAIRCSAPIAPHWDTVWPAGVEFEHPRSDSMGAQNEESTHRFATIPPPHILLPERCGDGIMFLPHFERGEMKCLFKW